MNDAEFKARVAFLLVGISYADLTDLEKDIFDKLKEMGVLTLNQYREVNYVKEEK
jgi:hypothetical protein